MLRLLTCRSALLFLAIACIVVLGGTAYARGNFGVAELQCYHCVTLNGQHYLDIYAPSLCASEEDCTNNDCRACGGTSECHPEYQDGPCHGPCECNGGGIIIEGDAPVTPTELDELYYALRAGAEGPVLSLLAAHPKRAWVNERRGAIQVFGCDDNSVVAHYAIPAALASALTTTVPAAPGQQ